jgi:MFS family permease
VSTFCIRYPTEAGASENVLARSPHSAWEEPALPTAPPDPDESPSSRDLLRRRDFGLYWWSLMVSSPGTWLHNITASVLMLTLTGSPFMVGVVNFAIFVPTLVFSLPAGALGDRVDKQRLVSVALGAGAVVAPVLTALSATGALTPALLVLTCFGIGTANAVAKPAVSAMVPLLVPRASVGRATALTVMQFQLGQIIGPGLASLILLTATPAWGFALNAVSFLGPILAMQLLRLRPQAPAARGERPTSATRDGLRFIRGTATMPAILVTVVLSNGAVEALRTLAPTIADGFGRPASAGIIVMGYSVGALLGLVSFGTIEKHLPRRWMLLTAFSLQAVGVTCVALAPDLVLTVAGALPIGIGFSLSTPLLSAALQDLSTDGYRSRVMSVFSMAHLGVRPVYALVAGAGATLVGTPATLAVFAAAAAVTALGTHRRGVMPDQPEG